MRYILRQAGLTALSFAVLYALLAALSFVVFPDPNKTTARNFQGAERTIFMTVPKYVFLGRRVLANPDKKILLLGASNTAVGFSQTAMQPKVSCAKISNLALGGANISEVKQIIDLVHEVQDVRDRTSNSFVIGLWFGMFVDSDIKFADPDRHRGDTDIDIERYRYGFSRRTADGPVTVLPPDWLDLGVIALRPLLLIEKAARESRATANVLLTGRRSAQRTDAERETVVMTPAEKESALRYWENTMGRKEGISDAEAEILTATVADLLKNGEKVTIVDLPIPAWHRSASPYQASYKAALKRLTERFAGNPDFSFLAMDDLDRNEDFSDEVHAKPSLAATWSNRLTDRLNSFICKNAKPEQGSNPS